MPYGTKEIQVNMQKYFKSVGGENTLCERLLQSKTTWFDEDETFSKL